jgi:hypothetical protein
MQNEELKNLPEFEKPGEEKSRKKKGGGFLSRLFSRGDKFSGAARGKTPKPGIAKTAGKALGRGARGSGIPALGRGLSFGSGRGAGGVFGKGFGSLFGSKAGLLGLMFGGAAIIAGGIALYNLASGPSGSLQAGLFQGSVYDSISDVGNLGDRSGGVDPGSDLAGNFFGNLGGEPANENLGELQNPGSQPAGYEPGLDAEDADKVAKVTASVRPKLQKSGGLGIGGSGGGGGGAAFKPGNLGAFQKNSKAATQRADTGKNFKARGAYDAAKTVFKRLGTEKGYTLDPTKQKLISAYDTGLRPSEQLVPIGMGTKGLGNEGVTIGEGSAQGASAPISPTNAGAPPFTDTNLNDDINEGEETENMERRSAVNKRRTAFWAAVVLAAGFMVWGLVLAGKEGTKTTVPGGKIVSKIKFLGKMSPKAQVVRYLMTASFLAATAALAIHIGIMRKYPEYTDAWGKWGVVAGYTLITYFAVQNGLLGLGKATTKSAGLIAGAVGGVLSFLRENKELEKKVLEERKKRDKDPSTIDPDNPDPDNPDPDNPDPDDPDRRGPPDRSKPPDHTLG